MLSNGNIGVRNGGSTTTGMWISRGAANTNGSLVVTGSTHNSHFHYDIGEETYTRAGKNSGRVVLNDIPGGNVVMGNGNGKLGINSGDPQYTLEVRQATNNTGIVLINGTNFNNWELRSEVYSTDNGTDCQYFSKRLDAAYRRWLVEYKRPQIKKEYSKFGECDGSNHAPSACPVSNDRPPIKFNRIHWIYCPRIKRGLPRNGRRNNSPENKGGYGGNC